MHPKRDGGAHRQVGGAFELRMIRAEAGDCARAAGIDLNLDLIGERKRHHQTLDIVVTVGTPRSHAQHEIDLGRRKRREIDHGEALYPNPDPHPGLLAARPKDRGRDRDMELRMPDQRLKVLIEAGNIQARVAELGAQITRDYAGKRLTLVGVLKGSFVFLADLMRAIDLPLAVDFIAISSYQGTQSTGVVQITADLSWPIEGQEVVIVEDIIDTGLTMRYLLENLATRQPASLKVASLLVKPSRAVVKVPVTYRGFEIPDEFVVGYGLDCNGKWRNLPFIGVIERSQ